MLSNSEVLNFYITISKYKNHNETIKMLVEHFYFKVGDKYTRNEFETKVNKLLEEFNHG